MRAIVGCPANWANLLGILVLWGAPVPLHPPSDMPMLCAAVPRHPVSGHDPITTISVPRSARQAPEIDQVGGGRGPGSPGRRSPTEPPNRPRQLPSDRFKRRAGDTVARQQAEILMDGTRKRLRFIACQRGSSARTFTVNKMNRFALQQLDITASREHQYEHPEIYRKLFLQINQRFSWSFEQPK